MNREDALEYPVLGLGNMCALGGNSVMAGEMQVDTALEPEILRTSYSFSRLKEAAPVVVFPNLNTGNIAYKLLNHRAEGRGCRCAGTGPVASRVPLPTSATFL